MKQNQPTTPNTVDRRQFLRTMSQCVGGVAAAALLSNNGLAVAMAFDPATDASNAKIFNPSQLTLLKHLCNVVIPATDTPGAGDINVHGFVDNQLYHCFAETEQQQVRAVLARVQQAAEKRFNSSFTSLSAEQQLTLLSQMEQAQGNFDQTDREQFKFLKSLICFGYYTSEVGATQELAYQAIPGGFKGEIAFSDVGRSWGSLAYY